MKTYRKERAYTTSFFFISKKKLGYVKNVQLLGVVIYFRTAKAHLLAYIVKIFPDCPQRLIAGVTWQRGKIKRMGFMFPQMLFYVTTILWKQILKNYLWDWSCYLVVFLKKLTRSNHDTTTRTTISQLRNYYYISNQKNSEDLTVICFTFSFTFT